MADITWPVVPNRRLLLDFFKGHCLQMSRSIVSRLQTSQFGNVAPGRSFHVKGIRTTEPKLKTRREGTFMSFRIEGLNDGSLNKDKVVQLLKQQKFVTVVPGV